MEMGNTLVKTATDSSTNSRTHVRIFSLILPPKYQKKKHSKIFQYKVLNRCTVDYIDDCGENKKWSTGNGNEDGKDSVPAGDDNAKNLLC